jgi:hypothetical protein
MKRNFVLTLLALILTIPTFAQQKDCPECKEKERKAAQEKMLKMKKATFIQNLKLSEEETEKFWALYEQYDKEINSVIEKQHHLMTKHKEGDLLNLDKETSMMLIEQSIVTEKELADIKARYYKEFLNVLPAQKVAKMIMEEKDIMRKLIKKERHEKKPQEKPQKTNPNSVQIMKK